MPFTLNPRVIEKLQALPDGPEKDFLIDLMKYEVEHNAGDAPEKRYKEEISRILEKHATRKRAEHGH